MDSYFQDKKESDLAVLVKEEESVDVVTREDVERVKACPRLGAGTVAPAQTLTDKEYQRLHYIAIVVDGEIAHLVGDCTKEAYAKTKAQKPKSSQVLVLKREHVFANKIYTTRARIGGKTREIQIDCGYNDDTRLCFFIDNKKVLQIKRIKWKFRGNEKIEVDGVPVQISWDVYNWLFEKDNDDVRAVFMFRFEEDEEEKEKEANCLSEKNGMALCAQQSWSTGLSRIEWRKMRKSLSSSSVSMSSSTGSSGGSSVMDWATTEESDSQKKMGVGLGIRD
jgi:hypothetical protein